MKHLHLSLCRIVLLCALAATLTTTHVAADVTIPDPGLDAAIRANLGLGPTDPITEAALAGITALNAENRGIADLTGLEYCTALFAMYADGNQISDLTPLQGLTNLGWLYLGGSQISDLTPLQGLTNLTTLALQVNQISNITLLQGLTNLQFLLLHDNLISDITPLQGLTNLRRLQLQYNHVSDLTPLQGLANLMDLDLSNNCIADLSALLGMTPSMGFLFVSADMNPLSDTAINVQIPQLRDNMIDVMFSTYSDENCLAAEGEGEPPVEGEGELPVEGEGEPPVEGEGEPPAPLELVAVGDTHFTRALGDFVIFEVQAQNAVGALSYQWYKLTNDKAMTPVGVDSPTHTILPITEYDFGDYQCAVHDATLNQTVLSPVFTLALAPQMPAVALLGLTLTAALTAFAGAAALRRKR